MAQGDYSPVFPEPQPSDNVSGLLSGTGGATGPDLGNLLPASSYAASPDVPATQISPSIPAAPTTASGGPAASPDPWLPAKGYPAAYASPFNAQYFATETEFFHETPGEWGNDYAMPVGQPIVAPWDGTVRWEQRGKQDWGNRVFLKGSHGWTFAVGHLNRFAVPNGTFVRAGQIIGYSGGAKWDPNSGNSTGAHIEPQLINPAGQYVDPQPWLRQIFRGGGPLSSIPASESKQMLGRLQRANEQVTAQDTQPLAPAGLAAAQPPVQPKPAETAASAVPLGGVLGAVGSLGSFVESHLPFLSPHGVQTASQPGAPANPAAASSSSAAPGFTLPSLNGAPAQVPQQSPIGRALQVGQGVYKAGLGMVSGGPLGGAIRAGLSDIDQALGQPSRGLAKTPAATVIYAILQGLSKLPGDALNDATTVPRMLAGGFGKDYANAMNTVGRLSYQPGTAGFPDLPWDKLSAEQKGEYLNAWFGQFGLAPGTAGSAAAGGELTNAARAADAAMSARAVERATPSLPGLAPTVREQLRPPPVSPPVPEMAAPAAGAQQTFQSVAEAQRNASPALASTAIPGLTPEMVDHQVARALAAAQTAPELWTGRTLDPAKMDAELRSYPPEAAGATASAKLISLSTELSGLLAQRQPGLRDPALETQITMKELEMGSWENASRNVLMGWDHPIAPTARALVDTLTRPYFAQRGGDFLRVQLPDNISQVIKLARGSVNAAVNLSERLGEEIRKSVRDPERLNAVVFGVEKERSFPGTPAEMFGPTGPVPAPAEAADVGTGLQATGPGARPIPDPVAAIMDEEYKVAGGASWKPTEEDAYRIAQQRGTWPPQPPEGSPLAPSAGPPIPGALEAHNLELTKPPPVELTEQEKQLAQLLRATLDAVGIFAAGEKNLFAHLREFYYPHIILGYQERDARTGLPTGRTITGAELRKMLARPPRRSILNPTAPSFRARTLSDTIRGLEGEGWIVMKSPDKVLPAYFRTVSTALANRTVLDFLKTGISGRDGRPSFVPGLRNGDPLDGQAFGVKDPRYAPRSAPERARWSGSKTHGYRYLDTEDIQGWIHPDVYETIKGQLQTTEHGLVFTGFHRFGEVYREFAMFNPLFHGTNQLSHQLMQSLFAGPLLWERGRRLLKDPQVMRDAATFTYMRPHRAALDIHDILNGRIPGPPGKWQIGDASFTNPFSWAVDKSHWFLFDHIIRNAQAASFILERDKLMRTGVDRQTASYVAGVRADRVVGVQDPAMRTEWERKLGPLAFFAYNWTKTHVLQPIESLPGVGRRVLAAEHPFLTEQGARLLEEEMRLATFKGMMTSIVYTQMLNMALSQAEYGSPRFTWQNDKGREMNLDVTWLARRLGYTGPRSVYIESPFMRFFDWYYNYWKDMQQYGGPTTLGGVGEGTAEFLKSKLMAPFSQVLQFFDDKDPNPNHKVLNDLIFGQFPLSRNFGSIDLWQEMEAGMKAHGLPGLVGQPLGDLFGANNSPQAQRLRVGVPDIALGGNPPKYGPQNLTDMTQVNQAWQVGMELLKEGISPALATQAERDAAQKVVLAQADPQGGYSDLEQQMQALQTKAVAEMGEEEGIDLSPAKQKAMTDKGQRPLDALDALHKKELFAKYPQLELWHQVPSRDPNPQVRAAYADNGAYYALLSQLQQAADIQQQQDDARLASQDPGQSISPAQWRDRRIRRLQGLYDPKTGAVAALKKAHPNAITDAGQWDAFLKAHGKTPPQVTRFDAAYEQYRAVNLDLPQYQFEDGTPNVLKWKADRDAVLTGMPADERSYIQQREAQDSTPTEQLYHTLTNQYLDFETQHADAVHLYHRMYTETNTPLGRKLYEAQHPTLFNYIIQRNLWFRHNPLAAEFFEHGYGLQKSVLQAGVSPFLTPAEQIGALLRNPATAAQLGAQGLDLTGLQTLMQQQSAPEQLAPDQGGSLRQSLYTPP